MVIKELKPQQGSVNLVLTIKDKGDIREFEKFGKKGRVCSCTAEDDSGKISLTLWNDDVDKVNAGDKIEITNGWVGEYRGELQLSTGKFGSLTVVEKGSQDVSVAAQKTGAQSEGAGQTIESGREGGASESRAKGNTQDKTKEDDELLHEGEVVKDEDET